MMGEIKPIHAIIFMKYHSQRVPGKNMRLLNGKPLFFYILNTLKQSKYITTITVDTDSDIIASDVKKYFDVNIHMRSKELFGDHIVANQILEGLLNDIEGEYFLQSHVTNPLLKTELIDDAIQLFFKHSESDSLFSATQLKTRLFFQDGKPINHDPQKLIMTQNLEPVFEENSNIYIFSRSSFKESKNRIGKKPMIYPMQKEDSFDIDEEIDFKWCEFLIKTQEI